MPHIPAQPSRFEPPTPAALEPPAEPAAAGPQPAPPKKKHNPLLKRISPHKFDVNPSRVRRMLGLK